MGDARLADDRRGRAGNRRSVGRAAAGLAIRGSDRTLYCGHPRRERRVGLIGNPVVVLDHVDARARERAGELCQRLGREPLRLERGAGQCAITGAHQGADSLVAETRPAKGRHQPVRQVELHEFDVRLQRRVAEGHVQQLAGFEAGRLDRELDPDAIVPRTLGVDGFDATHDFFEYPRVADRFDGHFDALLGRNRAGALLDIGWVGRHAIGGGEPARVVDARFLGSTAQLWTSLNCDRLPSSQMQMPAGRGVSSVRPPIVDALGSASRP